MFIVLKKKSIKRNLVIGMLLLAVGVSLLRHPVSSAMTEESLRSDRGENRPGSVVLALVGLSFYFLSSFSFFLSYSV